MIIVTQGKTYKRIEDVPAFDGYTFIRFFFPDKDDFYTRFYVQQCQNSQLERFKARELYVLIDDETIKLSAWSDYIWNHLDKNRKFITDSLRVYFVNQFDRCVYMDCDVYLLAGFSIPEAFEKDEPFVWDGCTGTLLYSPTKNNQKLNDFFNFYNINLYNKLLEGEMYDQHSDMVAYKEYLKWCGENNKDSLHSEPTPFGKVCHMSIMYPEFCNKTSMVIFPNCWWATKYPEVKERCKYVFSEELFWPFMDYFLHFYKDYGILPRFSQNIDPSRDVAITFS